MTQRVSVKIHYGWWIVTVTFLSLLMYSGCIYFSFSLFVKPLQAEFGWNRSTIMGAFAFMFLVIGISSPFVGRAMDRYGPKIAISLGALIAALGFGSLIIMDGPLHYYLSYVIIGMGGAGMGPVPSTAIVSNWFHEKRGLAIGIMSAGIGVGGMVITPFVGGVVIPHFGWKVGYVSLCALTSIMIPLAMIFIKTKPADEPTADAGKREDERLERTVPPVSASEDLTLRDALFSSAFWIIAGSFLLSQFGIVGTTQSQVPYLQDIGFPVTMAAAALGGVGLVSAFSKLFFGWLCDQIKPKYAFSIGVFFMAGGTFILMSVGPRSPVFILWIYAFVMGFGAGSWLPAMSMLVSTNFGLISYGAIFGAITLAFDIGVSTGPFLAGYIYDMTHSYYWAFVTFILLYFLAIPSMLFVRRPKIKARAVS